MSMLNNCFSFIFLTWKVPKRFDLRRKYYFAYIRDISITSTVQVAPTSKNIIMLRETASNRFRTHALHEDTNPLVFPGTSTPTLKGRRN